MNSVNTTTVNGSYLEGAGGLGTWFFARDHKKIAIVFLCWSMGLFLFGALLAMFLKLKVTEAGLTPELVRQMQTYHGVTMVFLVIVPAIPSILGYFLLPLQLGARNMAEPSLSRLSLWLYVIGSLLVLATLFRHPVSSGWTLSTAPTPTASPSLVVLAAGLVAMALSWVTTGINFVLTVHRQRRPGLTFSNLPILSWSLYLSSYVLVISGVVFALAMALLAVASWRGQWLTIGPIGALDWPNLFWFATTPAAFFAVIPAIGVVSEVIAGISRKAVAGYRTVVFSLAGLVVVSFLSWGLHSFGTRQDPLASMTFAVLSLLVVIPAALISYSWLATLYRGAIACAAATTYTLAFLVNISIASMLGLVLRNPSLGGYLSASMFTTAHIHYVLMGGVMTALLAGLHYWWPKFTGRSINETRGRISGVLYLVGLNLTFLPQVFMGTKGMTQGAMQVPSELAGLATVSSVGMVVMVAGLLLAATNFLASMIKGPAAAANPWGATTLEWSAASPPVVENFVDLPEAREPYCYR